MKHTILEEWQKAATDAGYTVKQVQGYEHFEALDGDRVVGRWNTDAGYLGETPPEAMGFGIPAIEPETLMVEETDVTTTKKGKSK